MTTNEKIKTLIHEVEKDLLAYTTATRAAHTMVVGRWDNTEKVLQLVRRVEDVVTNSDDPRFCVEDILDALIHNDMGTNNINAYLALSDADFELTCFALAISSRATYELDFGVNENAKTCEQFRTTVKRKFAKQEG